LTYRAAIIGLGRMGSTFDDEKGRFSRWQAPHAHAACYRAVAGVELLAGADPHPSQREAFGQKWGIGAEHLYADYREMLEREQPDIVSVTTPTIARAGPIVCAGRCRPRTASGSASYRPRAPHPGSLGLHPRQMAGRSVLGSGVLGAAGAAGATDAPIAVLEEVTIPGEATGLRLHRA
jgi:Oxidoreductase family, NAD-binding Rossmann fold